ncbi:hypothetical protein GPJ56_006845 [Histomonas meleagridis]|uniref:uncharacterized protein n=1 Tax=Histomonas meleagridis TaxID=135588 RepID=UPI003559AB2B|nr:hypothetical protein GPJ56_006845 [Histomonas meleagridis]KAH0800252.1 hypothetical protein GO595_007364 [Histomonas meleagridis]
MKKKSFDSGSYIEEKIAPNIEARIKELTQKRDELKLQNQSLNQKLLSLQRRNDEILKQLQRESQTFEENLNAHKKLYEKTKAECDQEIENFKHEMDEELKKCTQVLVAHRKDRNYLRFNLQSKKEIDETRIAMLTQRDNLTQQLKDLVKELRDETNKFEKETALFRGQKNEEEKAKLQHLIEEAKASIDKEKIDTLKEAESQSKILANKVVKFQKVVISLRDRYNKLLSEANELEMQTMEAKLVTQLVHPKSTQSIINKLHLEKEKIEEQKLKAKTAPEAENRRKATQHMNAMKKKRNELSGFIKLNSIKKEELTKLRELASNVIEQRNALVTFMNETMAALRHQIAEEYDQKGLPFRTSELILCHLKDGEERKKGGEMSPDEQLWIMEMLYSRFCGVPLPRNED